MGAIDKYLEFLWNCFQYDIGVFSKAWIYYWALVPAIGYFIFFILKWAILTAPVWLPLGALIRIFNLPPPKCRNCINKTQAEFEASEIAHKYKKVDVKEPISDSSSLPK